MKSIALITALLLMAICLIGCADEAVKEFEPEEEISNDEEAMEEDPSKEAEPEPADEVVIKGEDENVTIIIDLIRMTNQIPTDILEDIRDDPPVLSENHTFGCFYFTIPRIDDIYIRASERFSLYDEHGNQYQNVFEIFRGVTFTDLTSILSSSYLAEGATGKVLFHIPEQIEPVQLVFKYKYSIEADGEIEGSKQLEIPLVN